MNETKIGLRTQIVEKLKKTRFAGKDEIVEAILKNVARHGEAHLFDGGSDFDSRVSHDRHIEDKSYGEHWLVASIFPNRVKLVTPVPYGSRPLRDISERPTVLGDLETVDCGL